MDIVSAVASASIVMHQNQVQQSVDLAMLKKTMDTQETAAADLIESLNETVQSFGHKLDIKV